MTLEFKKINKSFGQAHILKDLSFKVESGQIFGFLGRNGAGKTTTIRILMGVFNQDSGEILLEGQAFNPGQFKIGYLPEERGMYSKTRVRDQLEYFAMLRGASRADAGVSVDYWTKRFEIDHYLDKKLETLSKGNQQKVQITQAFLNEPDILILDEPFSGLDPVNSRLFQEALSDYTNQDRIVIFSSHQMGYIENFCQDIAIIDQGRIVLQGNLAQIKGQWGGGKKRLVTNSDHLKERLRSLGYSLEGNKDCLIIDLGQKNSGDLLRDLAQTGEEVSLYSDYQPGLQEIFIASVGGSHE